MYKRENTNQKQTERDNTTKQNKAFNLSLPEIVMQL